MIKAKKQKDIAAVGSTAMLIFVLFGMFYFPYKAGKNFFQKYPTQAAKIGGIFLAIICAVVGFIMDVLVFNILMHEPPKGKVSWGDMFSLPDAYVVFGILLLIGVIVGSIKRLDKPIA